MTTCNCYIEEKMMLVLIGFLFFLGFFLIYLLYDFDGKITNYMRNRKEMKLFLSRKVEEKERLDQKRKE